MLKKTDLAEGACYFLLGFFDDAMRVPEITTYIYVGSNLLESDAELGDAWYFQDPESYMRKGVFTDIPDVNDYEILETKTEQLEWFYDLPGLVERISEIQS